MTKPQKCAIAFMFVVAYSAYFGGLFVVPIVAASMAIGMWIEAYIDESVR